MYIGFNNESYEIAARLFNTDTYPGNGLRGVCVDIGEDTFIIEGANQLDNETEIHLIVRRYDIEQGFPVGDLIRMGWDTTMEVN